MPSTPDELDSIDKMLAHAPETVTVFTLSWCGFCHAVKNLLQSLDIPFHTIELDTGKFAVPERHAALRQQLTTLTGSRTLPQVFIGRVAIGGYTETAAANRSGDLRRLLDETRDDTSDHRTRNTDTRDTDTHKEPPE